MGMLDPSEVSALNRGMVTLRVIWFSMLATLGIYLGLGIYLNEVLKAPVEGLPMGILRNVLYVVSFAMFVAAKFMRKRMLEKGLGGSGAVPVSGQSAVKAALGQYLMTTIISLALSESIGIYGLVLFFLGRNLSDLYALLAVAAVAMVYFRPRAEELAGLADRMKYPGG